MKTHVTKTADIERKWYVVDAEGLVLGRLAAEVASILRGKKKPVFQPNVDAGDYVIVVNADKVRVTGMKEGKKTYFNPSQYIGRSHNISFKDMMQKHPERIIEKAVKGMLPHTPLGRQMARKLHVYTGTAHKHTAQKPEILSL